ncbi:MAG: putative ABC transporter permease [Solirubrobacterales bacterium]
MKKFFKLIFITFVMGIMYVFTEILYRGGTYWQMALVGGVAGTLTGLTNNSLTCNRSLIFQGLTGMMICTTCEFTAGCYFNIYRNYGLWDYSMLPFNLLGQISLYYSFAWFILTFPVIFLYNLINRKMFSNGNSNNDSSNV